MESQSDLLIFHARHQNFVTAKQISQVIAEISIQISCNNVRSEFPARRARSGIQRDGLSDGLGPSVVLTIFHYRSREGKVQSSLQLQCTYAAAALYYTVVQDLCKTAWSAAFSASRVTTHQSGPVKIDPIYISCELCHHNIMLYPISRKFVQNIRNSLCIASVCNKCH